MPRSRPTLRPHLAPTLSVGVLRGVCKLAVLACVAGSTIAAPGAGEPAAPSPKVEAKAAPQVAPPDAAARLERYPTDLDFLFAVDGLSAQRATRAGFAAERFFSLIGAFDRTGDAWIELSSAIGMEPRQAVDALLGQQATVALRTDASGAQQIAVRSTVRRDARDRVSAAFKPSPRGLVRGIPVLSLGNGSIEMAVSPSDVRLSDGTACSELILAPKGSGALFEDMVRALREAPPDHALDLAWASLRSLGPSPIAMLLRDNRATDGPQEFFAMTARPTDEGWSADFVATRSMLDAGTGLLPANLVVQEATDGRGAAQVLGVIHPEALARTMRDGALLFMSGPVEMPHGNADDDNAATRALMRDARDRMPITAAMARFGFSDAIWSHLNGVAFVSVHAAPVAAVVASSTEASDRGIVMCVAFPVANIEAFAPIADAWGLSFAKGEADASGQQIDPASDATIIPANAVRAIEIHATSQSAELVGPRGAIAWTFAPAAGQESTPGASRGWWIVCAQTGEARAQDVVDRVQTLARDASSPGDASGEIVFRFMSRPALMRQITGARDASRTGAPDPGMLGAALANRVRSEASTALDALDRVETVIRRRPTFNELFDGTISIQMRPEP